MAEVLTAAEFMAVQHHLFNRHTYHHLRTRADWLLAYAYVSRSQLQRMIELADLGADDFNESGQAVSFIMRVTFTHSKTNQVGNVETAHCLR